MNTLDATHNLLRLAEMLRKHSQVRGSLGDVWDPEAKKWVPFMPVLQEAADWMEKAAEYIASGGAV